ncbi:MAG: ABC transporter ATP-binding protein [Candidatus Heimdallarchaeota archaeon]|nr:ABC transporter ATP-binding protein [Candidatus Heimdallarchaeota archaeon]
MDIVRWLIRFHLRYKKRLIFVMSMSIVHVFIYLFPVSITADILENVIQGRQFDLTGSLIMLFGLAFLYAALFFAINYANETLAHHVTTDMTQELFESLQEKSLSFHDETDIGQIMARATGDTRVINNSLSPGIVRILTLITAWMLAFVISGILDPLLLIITFVFFIIYVYSLVRFTKSRLAISQKVLVDFGDLSELSYRSVYGVKEIKSYAAEREILKNFDEQNSRYVDSRIREGEKTAYFYPALVVLFYATGIIVVAMYQAYLGILDFSEFILITGVIVYIRTISTELQWQVRMIISAIAGSERVFNLINASDPAPQLSEEKRDMEGVKASISFDNVSFRYRADLPSVLNNISFTIEENQTICIVGGPGSGKSTLTKLIQRLYLPTGGRVSIGGFPINEFKNDEYRKFISTVEQDIFLFNDTIANNIKFGKPGATQDEVEYFARLAQAHDFISSFPDAYNTMIGERGVRLSGGQAQRLSIARALMINPKILILDDGASALDARTELEIQKAIADILQTRTTILTTHRLSIIAKADLVLILEGGNLVGIGSHSSLIRTNIHYRKLFEHHYELPALEGMI